MSEYPGGPLDGLPEVVKTKAKHYQNIADSITRAVNTLHAISDSNDMQGKGISAIRDKAGDLADDISKAQQRYAQTASALTTYAGTLQDAQGDAVTANAGLRSVLGSDYDFSNTYQFQFDAQSGPHADDLKAPLKAWNDAKSKRDTAASKARSQIEDVVTGKHNNGLEDPKKHWWQKALDIVKKVCQVAGVLSIFLAWVPVLGEILLVLTAIGGVIDIAQNGFSWGAVFKIGMGALAVVGGLGTVLSKGGRIIDLVGRYSKEGKSAVTALSGDASLAAKARAFTKAGGARWWKGVKGAYRGLKNSKYSAITKALGEKGGDIRTDLVVAVGKHLLPESGQQIVNAMKNGQSIYKAIKDAPISVRTIEGAGKAANVLHAVGEGGKSLYDTHKEEGDSSARDDRIDREENQAVKDAKPADRAEVKREYEQLKKEVDPGFGKEAGDEIKKGLLSGISGGAFGGDD